MENSAPAFPNDAHRAAALVQEAAATFTPSIPAFQNFDPFTDRTSREIRNRLSEAFVAALKRLNPAPVRQEADALKGLSGPKAYEDYIHDRVKRYREVLNRAATRQIKDSRHLAILIWNAGLFFECHEYLETLWLNAEGDKRKALQGLIKAAGVFVHRELGRTNAAEKLSPKAAGLLDSYRKQLSFIANLDDLLSALNKNAAEAPELKGL